MSYYQVVKQSKIQLKNNSNTKKVRDRSHAKVEHEKTREVVGNTTKNSVKIKATNINQQLIDDLYRNQPNLNNKKIDYIKK